MLYAIDICISPIIKLMFFLAEVIPSVRKRYAKDGIYDAKKSFKDWNVKITENPNFSLATFYGSSLAMFVAFCLSFTIYHMVLALLYPKLLAVLNIWVWIVMIVIPMVVHFIFSERNDKGKMYILEFNKKIGIWRIKWAIITALSPIIAVWLALSSSKSGDIGRFILSLSGN